MQGAGFSALPTDTISAGRKESPKGTETFSQFGPRALDELAEGPQQLVVGGQARRMVVRRNALRRDVHDAGAAVLLARGEQVPGLLVDRPAAWASLAPAPAQAWK
jgi:hypothetical protein